MSSAEELLRQLNDSKKKHRPRLNSVRSNESPMVKDGHNEQNSFLKEHAKYLKFSSNEMKSLLDDFKKFSDAKGRLSKKQFEEVAKNAIGESFSSQSYASISKIFDVFDTEKTGIVDFVELATGMSNVIYQNRKDLLKFVYSLIDINNDGTVEKSELLSFFKKFFVGQAKMNGYKMSSERWHILESHLSQAFDMMDLDKSGAIDQEEFMVAVENPDTALGYAFYNTN